MTDNAPAWRKALIQPNRSIRDALQVIDDAALQIALVVDDEGCLIGTVTDGDVRRAILRGLTLENSLQAVMNRFPTVARTSDDRQMMLALMRLKHLRQIPVLDEDGKVVALETLDERLGGKQPGCAVLIAGGLGSRLAPLTDNCPKPMLRVGGKPLLETSVEGLRNAGYYRIFIAVNHFAEQISDYFGDGNAWGVEISYLHERERLGTAGPLSLLPEVPSAPILVMNGDILTNVDFARLTDFHQRRNAAATMAIREHAFQVPYGVVRVEGGRIVAIDEKPLHRFSVSCGIYVISPAILRLIPVGKPIGMPEVFDAIIREGLPTAVYPIHEYWRDIGQLQDFEKADREYPEVFGPTSRPLS